MNLDSNDDDSESAWERDERLKREREAAQYARVHAKAHVETVKEAEHDPRSLAERQAEVKLMCLHAKYDTTLRIATQLMSASTHTIQVVAGDGTVQSHTGYLQPAKAIDLALELQSTLDHLLGPGITRGHQDLDALREKQEKGVKAT